MVKGIFPIWKPAGMTSHDVVYRLRKITGVKKIGHAGTLDPAAQGVLITCITREYTKQISKFTSAEKEYLVGMTLGIETDTYDKEGQVTRKEKAVFNRAELERVVSGYIGEVQQIPPMYSAVHHKGKRLYELARKGITVERGPRVVTIKSISIENVIEGDYPEVVLRVTCGSGTYVRSLCYDIGRDLGCGAYASFITRTRVGEYSQKDCMTIEEFAHAVAQ